ncbi:MAG: hypothetical protein QXQ29_00960 [Candidatus Bathyarchaeia archaeon]
MREFNEDYLGFELDPRDIMVVDSTLREGEQAAGVALTLDEKLRIAGYDDEVGLDFIEVFTGYGDRERMLLEGIKKLGLRNVNVQVWNRLRRSDIDLCLKYDFEWVSITAGFSDIHLRSKFRCSFEDLLHSCLELISYCREHGLKVSLHLEDSTRTSIDRLVKILSEVDVDRVRDCDTVSVLIPISAYNRMKVLTEYSRGIPIEVHYHNDRGLALANTISAILAGASSISATWNGLGDKAGNAALDEVLLLVYELYGTDRFNLSKAVDASLYVAEASCIPVYRFKPVSGYDVFSVQSGIHQDGILKDPETYQPYPPRLVGRDWRIVLGVTSGTHGLSYLLARRGYKLPDDEKAREILAYAKTIAENKKGYLDDDDLDKIARRFNLEGISN